MKILTYFQYTSTMAVVRQKNSSHVIRTKQQLAPLASSARQEIVDMLSQMGTVPVAELAAALGRPADAIYYHLRALERAGLVIHSGNRKQGKRKAALFCTVSPDLKLLYRVGPEGNAREITAIVSSMLRLGARDFRRALQRGGATVSGPRRELWALRRAGWLTPGEIVGVNRSIESLASAVSKPRGKGRLYAITVVLTPVDHGRGKGIAPRHIRRNGRSR
jgi:DNA-binding transcriptional ArsR family regulator